MAGALPIYSSRKVEIAFLGFNITGVASNFASISRNEDLTTVAVGAFGESAIAVNPNRTGMFELTVFAGSPADIALSSVVNYEELNNTKTRGSFTFKDSSGGAIALLSDCHIQATPTLDYSAEYGERTWKIFAEGMQFLVTPEGIVDELGILAEIKAGIDNLGSFAG